MATREAVKEPEAEEVEPLDEETEGTDEKKVVEKEKAEKKPAAPKGPTGALNDLRNKEDRNLKEWLEELSPDGAIRVKVTRQNPKMWKGLNVGGTLANYDQMIDDDFIREHHGGGTFYLIVQRPKKLGSGWEYAGGRVVNIAGDPRTDDVFRDKSGEAPVGSAAPATAIVDRVVSSMEKQLEAARADRGNHGDSEAMRMMMAQAQRQLDSLQAMLRDKDVQLAQAQQVKPAEKDEFRDKMLDKLLDGDSARITALRNQYESELRQVKQSAIDNESRLRDSFDRDKQQLSMSHDRELNALRSAYDMRVAAQETAHNTSRTLMDGEIRRLQGDLTEAKSELAALRLKKDKTILEQASEFSAIQEAMEGFGGGKEKEPGTIEKIFGVVAQLPAVQAGLAKLGGAEQPAQPQQPQAAQPRLMTGPDGNLYQQLPGGQMRLVRKRPQASATPPAAGGEAPVMPTIPATTIKIAVDYLEAAFRNDQDPEMVATSVRTMIPAEVMAVIRNTGVDGFLTNVAKLDASSPLTSQAGKNWSRKVGKALLGE